MNQLHFPRGKRIAVIESHWFHDIVRQGTNAFVERMSEAGIPSSSIDVVTAPGAFEIPLKAKRLAKSGKYAAIVGCALVADGGIYRHDFVSSTVIQGLMDVQLMTDVPVFSVVLTPHTSTNTKSTRSSSTNTSWSRDGQRQTLSSRPSKKRKRS